MEILGSGSFGIAWLVKNNKREKCVIKEVSMPVLKVKDKEAAINEVKILSTLRHKNIVRYKEAFIHEKNLCICMEYADDGDLASKIKQQAGKLFLELKVIDWFVQILIAVKYIHGLHILHRDLKSQNIFLTSSGLVKVGDFGISRFLDSGLQQARTAIGTPYYLSPEICQQKPYNHKSDMWSLGVLLYELATLKHPFMADDFSCLVVKIIKGKYKPLSNVYGPLVQDLVLVLLQVRPEDRPSAAQLLKVPLLQPHVKSYLMRVKHKEEPVIFDSGIFLNSDDEKGRRKSSPETSYTESDKSGESKSGKNGEIERSSPLNDSSKSKKRLSNSSDNSTSGSSFEKTALCSNNKAKLVKEARHLNNWKDKLKSPAQSFDARTEETRKGVTPPKNKPSKVNFIERNKCLAATPAGGRMTQTRLTRVRRLNTTPSSSPNNAANQTANRYNLRSRAKSNEQRIPLLAARMKQLSGNTTVSGEVKAESASITTLEPPPTAALDPNIKFPNVRKRASSLMNAVARSQIVPCKLSRRTMSCNNQLPLIPSAEETLVNTASQTQRRRRSVDVPNSKRNVISRPSILRSRTDLARNEAPEKTTIKRKKRRSSVGLPSQCNVPKHVQTKIAGRLRAASVACDNLQLKSPEEKKESEDEQFTFEVSTAPLHSTMIDYDSNVDGISNIIPNGINVESDNEENTTKKMSKTLKEDTILRRPLNKKHASTYTVIQPLNKGVLRFHLCKKIGAEKLKSSMELARKIKLSANDVDVLKRVSEALGSEHRDMLPSLFELAHFERDQMN